MIKEKKQLNSKQEFFLEKFLESPSILKMLEEAVSIEKQFIEGQDLEDGVIFSAYIRSNGLWEASISCHLGTIIASALNEKINEIELITIPDFSSSVELENINKLEQRLEAKNYSKSCVISLGNIKSLRKAKNTFRDDYVLSNIVVEQDAQRSSVDYLAIIIRNFRKELIKYQNKFSPLWRDTGFVCALDIQTVIQSKGGGSYE